jgi:hypothetical protein
MSLFKNGALAPEAGRMISIWFFIGISLAVNGALILAAGLYQLINPPENPGIVLYNLHANVWWGAVLLLIGLFYCIRFRPRRSA